MDRVTLLEEAKAAGLSVAAAGGRLVIQGPRRAEPVARRLLENKALVLAALQSVIPNELIPNELPPEWHLAWDERAAIMEYDGGLLRERAEALALADIRQSMARNGSTSATMLDIVTSSRIVIAHGATATETE